MSGGGPYTQWWEGEGRSRIGYGIIVAGIITGEASTASGVAKHDETVISAWRDFVDYGGHDEGRYVVPENSKSTPFSSPPSRLRPPPPRQR